MRIEAKFAGFGGQGIILLGHIYGKSVALGSELYSSFTQSYGPEARGGACSANIILEDKFVSYPGVTNLNYIVFMSQESYTVYKKYINDKTVIIIDEELVKVEKDHLQRVLKIPALKIAIKTGRKIVANMVMLGFFTAVTELVSREAMEKALEDTLSPKVISLNLKAFTTGFEHYIGERKSQEQTA